MNFEEMKEEALLTLSEHRDRLAEFENQNYREVYLAALMIEFAARHAILAVRELQSGRKS